MSHHTLLLLAAAAVTSLGVYAAPRNQRDLYTYNPDYRALQWYLQPDDTGRMQTEYEPIERIENAQHFIPVTSSQPVLVPRRVYKNPHVSYEIARLSLPPTNLQDIPVITNPSSLVPGVGFENDYQRHRLRLPSPTFVQSRNSNSATFTTGDEVNDSITNPENAQPETFTGEVEGNDGITKQDAQYQNDATIPIVKANNGETSSKPPNIIQALTEVIESAINEVTGSGVGHESNGGVSSDAGSLGGSSSVTEGTINIPDFIENIAQQIQNVIAPIPNTGENSNLPNENSTPVQRESNAQVNSGQTREEIESQADIAAERLATAPEIEQESVISVPLQAKSSVVVQSADIPAAITPVELANTKASVIPIRSDIIPAVIAPIQTENIPAAIAPIQKEYIPSTIAPIVEENIAAAIAPIVKANIPAAIAPNHTENIPAAIAPIQKENIPAAISPADHAIKMGDILSEVNNQDEDANINKDINVSIYPDVHSKIPEDQVPATEEIVESIVASGNQNDSSTEVENDNQNNSSENQKDTRNKHSRFGLGENIFRSNEVYSSGGIGKPYSEMQIHDIVGSANHDRRFVILPLARNNIEDANMAVKESVVNNLRTETVPLPSIKTQVKQSDVDSNSENQKETPNKEETDSTSDVTSDASTQTVEVETNKNPNQENVPQNQETNPEIQIAKRDFINTWNYEAYRLGVYFLRIADVFPENGYVYMPDIQMYTQFISASPLVQGASSKLTRIWSESKQPGGENVNESVVGEEATDSVPPEAVQRPSYQTQGLDISPQYQDPSYAYFNHLNFLNKIQSGTLQRLNHHVPNAPNGYYFIPPQSYYPNYVPTTNPFLQQLSGGSYPALFQKPQRPHTDPATNVINTGPLPIPGSVPSTKPRVP